MRKKVDIAKDYGCSIARTLFYDFLNNPGYRGEKFSWLGIVDYVTHIASTQVGLNLCWKNRSEKLLSACQEIASESARLCFLDLIKEHGFYNNSE